MAINVLEWEEISRAAVLNCMVAGGELIGFGLVFLAFWPLIRYLLDERKDLKEALRILMDKNNV